MLLVMNTENTRVLASTYEDRSDGALDLQTTLNRSLELAAVDDTYDVAGSLTALSEELHIGGVVLAHQADIMDGLVVDVDALAEELGVKPWEIRKQLERAERGKIDLGDVLAPIVTWGDSTTVGLDTTIRDFVPDAPEIGVDPEFDALIQRLDGWLLSAVVDGTPLDQLLTSAGRQADALALATRMGMQDLSTVIVSYEETKWEGNSDDGRNVTYARERALDPDEYHEWTFDWLVPQLTDERKLSRLAVVPTIGELFNLDTYTYTYQDKPMGGDQDYVTRTRTKERSAAQIADEIERINTEYADLAWLPSVLAGLTDPPPGALTPAVLARLGKLNGDFGGSGEPLTTFTAETFLGGRSVIARALENPRPIQKARLPFAAGALDASIEFGRQQGVVTEQHEAEAQMMAQYLTGFDPQLGFETITAEELEAEAPDLDIQDFVGMLASRVSPEQLTENRIIQAYTYAKRGASVGDRMARIEQAILGFRTVVTVGEPAMTKHDWLSSLPAKARGDEGHFKTDIEGEEFNWLLEHAGVPGYHKSRDWRRGKGKRYFHLVNDEIGAVDDFIVEVVPKKRPWWSTAIFTVAKVAMSIVAPPLGVAIAVMDAAIAASQGDWLGAGLAALGAITAGTAAWASSTASAATTATSNVMKAADAVRAGTGSAAALTTANQAFTAANTAANLANTVASGAQFVNAGVRAGVAFSNDDLVGGLVGSVGALAAGANGFGSPDVASNLTRLGQGIQAVDTTVKAIEGDDIAGAIAGGISAGAAIGSVGANAAEGTGLIGAGTNETLQRVATTAQTTGNLVGSGAAIVQGVEDEQWGALVGQGLRFGSSAVNLVADQNGVVSGMVFDRANEEAFAASTGQLQDFAGYGSIAADFADGGLAIANDDYLGGAALISGGTTALIKDMGFESKHFTRLDQLTSIADKVVKAGPDADDDTLAGLIGSDVSGFVDTFRAPPEQVTLRSGNPAETLGVVRAERQAAEASLEVLDNLLAIGSQGTTATQLVQAQRSRLASELGLLNAEEKLAEEAYVVTAEASLPAPLLPSHVPMLRPPLPTHMPQLRPPVPGHIPVFRPEDLFAAGSGGLVVPGPGGTLLTPPMAVQGAPPPGAPRVKSIEDFPPDHMAHYYQNLRKHYAHPAQLTPDGAGDWNVEFAVAAPKFESGPWGLTSGPLGVLGFGQETFADSRKGIGSNAKYGTRFGGKVPVPFLPGLEFGFTHDNLTELPDASPIDAPLGGWSYQSIGPAPGVAPNELYDLAHPFGWPVGASVRLNKFTGDEYHWNLGNVGDNQVALFGDEIRHDLDFFQMTNQGDRIEIAQGPVDIAVSQPGVAATLDLSDYLPEWLPSSYRFGASMQAMKGSAELQAAHYGPLDHTAQLTHLLERAPASDEPLTDINAAFGSLQGWVDGTTGASITGVDNSVNVAKLSPLSQYFVGNLLEPDRDRTSVFRSDGYLSDTVTGTTASDADGRIQDVELEIQFTPLAQVNGPMSLQVQQPPVPVKLGMDDFITYREAEQQGRDPVAALRGRPGIPPVVFETAANRGEFRRAMNTVDDMGSYDHFNPHAGNLSVYEDHHGNKRLDLTNPYPAMVIEGIADDYPYLNFENRPIHETVMTLPGFMNGVGQGLLDVKDAAVDAAEYGFYGTAYGGVKIAEYLGAESTLTEGEKANAKVFEDRYLEGTIATGRMAADYVSARADDPSLLVDDAVAVKESARDFAVTTMEAWDRGDEEYFGELTGHLLGGGALLATGAGAPALAAKGASKLGRVAKHLGGRRGDGSGPEIPESVLLLEGPEPRLLLEGPEPGGSDFERYVGELNELHRSSTGGPASAAEHERYLHELRRKDAPPPVDDAELRDIYHGENGLFRENAKIGSGSTPSAAEFEHRFDASVGGVSGHSQKTVEGIKRLEEWLDRQAAKPPTWEELQQNPTQRARDIRAAENTLQDHVDFVEQYGDRFPEGSQERILYEKHQAGTWPEPMAKRIRRHKATTANEAPLNPSGED